MNLDDELMHAARILREGGVGAFPTETVYGLGASMLRPEAIARVFEVKKRPHFDPLIVHLPSLQSLKNVARVPEHGKQAFDTLTRAFWPGPLTLLLPKLEQVPDLVTSGLSTVGVRMPSHPLAQKLLQEVGAPVCAPSANRFGKLSPTTAEHVRNDLGARIDFVLDGGPCSVGLESTIVSLIDPKPMILRPGGVSKEDIESALGHSVKVLEGPSAAILAPGQLQSHYAPRTPLKILYANVVPNVSKKRALLAWSQPNAGYGGCEVLSPTKDMKEAAVRLFSCLHRLDRLGLEGIEVEPVPEVGLGLAIMNRLKKAAHPA